PRSSSTRYRFWTACSSPVILCKLRFKVIRLLGSLSQCAADLGTPYNSVSESTSRWFFTPNTATTPGQLAEREKMPRPRLITRVSRWSARARVRNPSGSVQNPRLLDARAKRAGSLAEDTVGPNKSTAGLLRLPHGNRIE